MEHHQLDHRAWKTTTNKRHTLTRAGQKRLDAEQAQWDRLTKAVGKVLRFA
jgi:hypothetical protein